LKLGGTAVVTVHRPPERIVCFVVTDMKRIQRWCVISISNFTTNFSTTYKTSLYCYF